MLWYSLKEFLNKHLYCIISRRHIMQSLRGYETTIDNYRCILTKAGFLEIVSTGQYKILKKIPEDLSVFACQCIAYGIKDLPL